MPLEQQPDAKGRPSSSNAAAPLLFETLDVAHQSHGRVRYRYTLPKGCAKLAPQALERVVRDQPGVTGVRLNPAARSIAIQFDGKKTSIPKLQRVLSHIPASVCTGASGAAVQAASCCEKRRAGENVLSTGGDLLASALLLLTTNKVPQPLAKPATLAVSLPLYKDAIEDLLKEGLNNHVLEALAVAISTASGDQMAANATLFMLALGEYLEESIARRSDDLLKHLLHPDADTVWVEREGEEVQIDAAQVVVGDTVICAAGAVIPVDGTVLSGEATVNEASMTGESVPALRQRGNNVLCGTVIEEGRIRIYAEHVGTGTASARIANYVQHALQVKSGTQLTADRLADKLVPWILGLAGSTWLVSRNWKRAAAVLQADYACALKLSTPVAFKSAMYTAGRDGVLFKGGDALERLSQADTFVFDKTGTLTTGTLVVTDVLAFDPEFDPTDVLDLAASVEEHYFHPLAHAVVEAARRHSNRHFPHEEVDFIAAHGVASVIQGKRVVVGSRHFLEEHESIDMGAHEEDIERLQAEGKTPLYIGLGGKLLGIIALKDSLRTNTAETLKRLRTLGVKRILMLTGDHEVRAAELARELGLDAYHAQLLPEDKARILHELTESGAKIAFVGDGMNDAPALAGAHVGIAMQRGADLARLTSDIALLEDDIARVADAKAIANRTMKQIDTNFKLIVGANTAILAGAATGKLSPIATSVLHNGSTIAILLNALRGGLQAVPGSTRKGKKGAKASPKALPAPVNHTRPGKAAG